VYAVDGQAFVRLEDIDVSGAPDIVVRLVPEPGQERPDGGVELGALKGNVGSSNYVLPDGVDPGDDATVLLWCRAFSVPIGSATLR
jgi:hypothetical protein